jgi:hypothetical protein
MPATLEPTGTFVVCCTSPRDAWTAYSISTGRVGIRQLRPVESWWYWSEHGILPSWLKNHNDYQ